MSIGLINSASFEEVTEGGGRKDARRARRIKKNLAMEKWSRGKHKGVRCSKNNYIVRCLYNSKKEMLLPPFFFLLKFEVYFPLKCPMKLMPVELLKWDL